MSYWWYCSNKNCERHHVGEHSGDRGKPDWVILEDAPQPESKPDPKPEYPNWMMAAAKAVIDLRCKMTTEGNPFLEWEPVAEIVNKQWSSQERHQVAVIRQAERNLNAICKVLNTLVLDSTSVL